MSRKNALEPLSQRMNPYQQGRRASRILARRTIAESLGMFVFTQTAPMRAGFLGRLKWLMFGAPAGNRLPSIRLRNSREQHS